MTVSGPGVVLISPDYTPRVTVDFRRMRADLVCGVRPQHLDEPGTTYVRTCGTEAEGFES